MSFHRRKTLLGALAATEALAIVFLAALYLGQDRGEGTPAPGPAPPGKRPSGHVAPGTKPARPNQQTTKPTSPARTHTGTSGPGQECILLYGRITTEEGEGIDGGRLTLIAEDRDLERLHRRTTPVGGEYGLILDQAGPWEVRYENKGWGRVERDLVVPRGCRRHRLDLEVSHRPLLEVHFLDLEGKPLRLTGGMLMGPSFLYALATREIPQGPLPLLRNRCRQANACSLWHASSRWPPYSGGTCPCLGEIELLRPPPLFIGAYLRSALLATRPVAPGQEVVEFRLDPRKVLGQGARIRFRLLAGTAGAPLEKVRVHIGCISSGGSRRLESPDGVYRTPPISPGIVDFGLHAIGHARWRRHLRLSPGQEMDLGTLHLPAAASLSGQVKNDRGEPVQAMITWCRLEDLPPAQPIMDRFHFQGRTAKQGGGFTLENLGRGRHLVRAFFRPDRKSRAQVATRVVQLGDHPLEGILLRTVPATRLIARNRSERGRACTFTLLDGEGNPVWADRVDPKGRKRTWVEPGHYTVRIHRGRQLCAEFPLVVGKVSAQVAWPR